MIGPPMLDVIRVIRPNLRRWLVPLLLLVVASYGALLRLDALSQQYGPVQQPAWLRAVQEQRLGPSRLRPSGMTWERVTGRYISDPYTYLQYAREMTSFYAAHRREPLFPFATRVSLDLLGDQDVAVSFASAAFSVLVIVATGLLGALAFSPFVGLAAAAAVAIEFDLISWGTRGWRDDAFTLAVVLTAYACVRTWRTPSHRNALLLGVVGGAACLVRITSLSFVVPALLLVVFGSRTSRRIRLQQAGIAALVTALLVGPFLINCWRVYGDPLYAINVHADIYRATEGDASPGSQTAAEYLGGMLRARPVRTLDTFVLGMTSYPFANKWQGFDVWHPAVARVLAPAAVLGLLLMAATGAGRILLIVGATSLVPYAMTWRLIADWRFTEHVYPLLLIAAMLAIAWPADLAWRAWRSGAASLRPSRALVVRWSAGIAAVVLAALVVVRWLPVWTVREALEAGEDVTIFAGGRDGAFFRGAWSGAVRDGNVTTRSVRGPGARVMLPLLEGQAYEATVRLDPDPRPAPDATGPFPIVRLTLNDQPVAAFPLEWNPARVGAYDIALPATVVSTGSDALAVSVIPASTDPDSTARLWYVRVRPVVPAQTSSPTVVTPE